MSGQLVCYVVDLGDEARGPAGDSDGAGAGFLHEGFFLQTVTKGV